MTSYEVTMGGTAYGEHRKAAVGWTEERASPSADVVHGYQLWSCEEVVALVLSVLLFRKTTGELRVQFQSN